MFSVIYKQTPNKSRTNVCSVELIEWVRKKKWELNKSVVDLKCAVEWIELNFITFTLLHVHQRVARCSPVDIRVVNSLLINTDFIPFLKLVMRSNFSCSFLAVMRRRSQIGLTMGKWMLTSVWREGNVQWFYGARLWAKLIILSLRFKAWRLCRVKENPNRTSAHKAESRSNWKGKI